MKVKNQSAILVYLISNPDRVATFKRKPWHSLVNERIDMTLIPLVEYSIHHHDDRQPKGFGQKEPKYKNDLPVQAISGKKLDGEEVIFHWNQIGAALFGYVKDGLPHISKLGTNEIPGIVNRRFSEERSIQDATFSH